MTVLVVRMRHRGGLQDVVLSKSFLKKLVVTIPDDGWFGGSFSAGGGEMLDGASHALSQ